MRSAVLSFLLVASLAVLATSAAAEIVKLRDGSLVHGTITEFDEASGFTVRRVDTGGELRLRWEHLPPDEVRRIKASRGFTGEEAEPWMVDVVHLVMRNGTTETGVLVEGGPPSSYRLRRRGVEDSFPRGQVRTVEPGQVEGLEVYSPEDLYREIVAVLGAPTDAVGQLALAIACEGAKLYEAARDHFLAVRELDPALKSELVATRLAQIAIKIEDAAETAELDEVRSRLYRKQFEQARELAASFRQRYPASRQQGELVVLEGEIDRGKREHFGRRIVGDYFDLLERHANELARDDGVTLDVVRQLCEEGIHAEIVAQLAKDYVMTEDGVQVLWDRRSGGSVRTSSYSDGTFILGKDKALDFGRFDTEEETVDPEVASEDQFDDLVEKVKKQREALAQQRRASSRGNALADNGPNPDEWWAAADTDTRRRWILSYYAEFSAALRVIEAKPRSCRRCDATGIVQGTNDKGEIVELGCPVCKGLRQERIVRAR